MVELLFWLLGFSGNSRGKKKQTSHSVNEPKRRIVLPERRVQVELEKTVKDITAESIVESALQTVAIEVMAYRSKVAGGKRLDLKEARVLQGYIKAMCELSKEQRDRDRAADLDKLSEPELLALAKKVLNNSTIPEAEFESKEPDAQEDDESD